MGHLEGESCLYLEQQVKLQTLTVFDVVDRVGISGVA